MEQNKKINIWKFNLRVKIILLIFVILVIAFLVQLYIDANVIEISYYNISSNKIPLEFDGYKILHISDLHSKEFGEGNYKLIKKIDEINPDVIMVTGDMVNATDKDFTIFFELAEYLGRKAKTYYIVGNHELDLKSNDLELIYNTLASYGIITLDNEKAEIEENGQTIGVYGMWYNMKYYSEKISKAKFTKDIMKQIMGESSKNKFEILLTHNPIHFNIYGEWGADLTLAGHIHGGMIRLPFLGGLISPDRTLFPEYSEGIYEKNNVSMIVSRGLGRGLNGFRLFNRPELGVITLQVK